MKYFKVTSQIDAEDIFYTSSTSDHTTAEDIEDLLKLNHYTVEECAQEEFERETEEEDPKAEALQLIDEIKACLYEIEDFGEQDGFIDEQVMEYIDTISEKVQELECQITSI